MCCLFFLPSIEFFCPPAGGCLFSCMPFLVFVLFPFPRVSWMKRRRGAVVVSMDDQREGRCVWSSGKDWRRVTEDLFSLLFFLSFRYFYHLLEWRWINVFKSLIFSPSCSSPTSCCPCEGREKCMRHEFYFSVRNHRDLTPLSLLRAVSSRILLIPLVLAILHSRLLSFILAVLLAPKTCLPDVRRLHLCIHCKQTISNTCMRRTLHWFRTKLLMIHGLVIWIPLRLISLWDSFHLWSIFIHSRLHQRF